MEGASTSAVTGSHRASFNAAYTTLEQSIRNFSKEKLMYEQTIEGLNEQIALVKESFQRLNLEHQDLMAENQRLMTIQDENEKTRHGVDALIASVERKQEIIQDTVYGFESIEQDFLSRYDAHEEFLYCLKYRQIQLVQCFEEANKQNESLRMSLGDVEKKYQFATQQLSEAKLQMEENSANFLEEKSRLIDEYQGIIDELVKHEEDTELYA
ncbi:unnamed protein product [Orchesella dallaii]|uniref:Uncharacterized protein n=1 Tax=Orchesella dallaii TaxID=48710 RepID=A0ABP1PPD7_9HEXA